MFLLPKNTENVKKDERFDVEFGIKRTAHRQECLCNVGRPAQRGRMRMPELNVTWRAWLLSRWTHSEIVSLYSKPLNVVYVR